MSDIESRLSWKVDSQQSKDAFLEYFDQTYEEHHHITVKLEIGKQVSTKQKNALHVYCRMLSKALGDAGLDMKQVLRPGTDIPWTEISVKEFLWRPIQKAMTGKKSTKEPYRKDYGEIYDVINRYISDKFGVHVPWPVKKQIKHIREKGK